jgi:hypothetical protein
MTDEQKEYYCRFKLFYNKDAENTIEYLKDCQCFDEKDWKRNFKHALQVNCIVDLKGVEILDARL